MRHDQRTDDDMRLHHDELATAAGRNQPNGHDDQHDRTAGHQDTEHRPDDLTMSDRADEHRDEQGDEQGNEHGMAGRHGMDGSDPVRMRAERMDGSDEPMARSPQHLEADPEPTPMESDHSRHDTLGEHDRTIDAGQTPDHDRTFGHDKTMDHDRTFGHDTTMDHDRDTGDHETLEDRDADRDADHVADSDAVAVAAPRMDTGAEEPLELFRSEDVERYRTQWREIQIRFVDDPRDAVQSADHLLAEVIKALATSVNEHKTQLEGQWAAGGQTEDLRLTLRRYRSFLNQMLDV